MARLQLFSAGGCSLGKDGQLVPTGYSNLGEGQELGEEPGNCNKISEDDPSSAAPTGNSLKFCWCLDCPVAPGFWHAVNVFSISDLWNEAHQEVR